VLANRGGALLGRFWGASGPLVCAWNIPMFQMTKEKGRRPVSSVFLPHLEHAGRSEWRQNEPHPTDSQPMHGAQPLIGTSRVFQARTVGSGRMRCP
jgi:hypothetical protein